MNIKYYGRGLGSFWMYSRYIFFHSQVSRPPYFQKHKTMTTYFGSTSYALLPALAILTAVLNVFKKRLSVVLTDTIHSFAIGSILAVVIIKLLPDVIRHHRTLETCVGIGIGMIATIVLRYFFDKQNDKLENAEFRKHKWKTLLTTTAVHLSIDGIVLGIGFSFGKTEGILLAVALALEAFTLGLTVIEGANEEENANKKSILALSILSVLFVATTAITMALIPQVSDRWMKMILPVAATVLFTKVLTTEVKEGKEFRNQTKLLITGFIVFAIIGLVV